MLTTEGFIADRNTVSSLNFFIKSLSCFGDISRKKKQHFFHRRLQFITKAHIVK